MKKILLSIGIIAFAGFALAAGGTGAFFSDTETSTGNTFTAGAIDLKIDNTSYYNGVASPNTSWSLVDLTIEKFFNFDDVKPGDTGEDTISLHVDSNDSYLCANVTLTSDDDNSLNEPESLDGDTTGGVGEGELADAINFIWWADDGDNVLETGENTLPGGPIGALDVGESATVTLADSVTNIWTGIGGPVTGNSTVYIGKAWCFGPIAAAPLAQDGSGIILNPSLDNDGNQTAGQPADGGISCSGAGLNNITQTDSLTADVSFSAVQARHNDDFLCTRPESTTLTLVKNVINNNLGVALATDWTLSAAGPTPISGVTASLGVTAAVVTPGIYTLSESAGPGGYTASTYSCSVNGGATVSSNTVTLAAGDNAVCTITNDDNSPQACLPTQEWADSVVTSSQGTRKNGTAVLVARSNSNAALGAAETTGSIYDNPPPANSTFFSLGFKLGTPLVGGSATLQYTNNIILNGTGNDIKVYEVTGGTSYPDEHIKIEASQNGVTWFTLVADGVRDAEADLQTAGLAWAKYVRVTDVSPTAPFEATADAFDLDAVKALNCAQPVIPQVS